MKSLKKTLLIVSTTLCLGLMATAASAHYHGGGGYHGGYHGGYRGGYYHHGYYNNGAYIYETTPYYYDNYYDYGTPGIYLNFGGGHYNYHY